ncbi:polyprenyl synthetase family protein [Desulfosporosinus sp. FKA]|uniref:polyprenyl synthetase family protein n=1 Tax=Desulfosporosinus sp. FKA TaxID=1969834 RepID=UPI000B4A50E4|nr:polyprenyl synthetase family protein [Desulfosporosinus sp. FKA]
MQDNWTMIEQVMLQLIHDYFPTQELKKYMSEFVRYKTEGHFPFGQLVIFHYQMFGGQSTDIFRAAAAVELMILSLDIFDDLQDNDNFSVPWNNIDHAIVMNIATGLLMLSTKSLEHTSFELNKKVKATNYLNSCVIKAINGQHLDLVDLIESEKDYIEMVRSKSGSLMASACLVGTALASENHHDVVNNYAEHLGIIAQIKNDINDIVRLDPKNDLVNKRKTLPTLYLLNLQQSQYQFVRDYFTEKTTKNELLNARTEHEELIRKSGVLEYAQIIIRINQLQAIELIDKMSVQKEWKNKLLRYF